MIEGFETQRGMAFIRNPIRSAVIIPPVEIPDLTPAEKAIRKAKRRKQNRKRVLMNIMWLTIIIVSGVGISGLGGWFLGGIPGCEGLNIIWGIVCGLGMLFAHAATWKSKWEVY